MVISTSNCQIWAHLIDMLDGGERHAGQGRLPGSTAGRSAPSNECSAVRSVRILERLSRSTISVSWQDPTACRYEDQVWKVAIARRPGICALTHAAIEVGDLVYRPVRVRHSNPVNLNFLILATVVEDVPVLDA
ncbi:DUF3331 domain-containing protein [Burkholderia ubonensis]|uniref:DUF3331 domain-containing protein n=1 Tax=Burkholderia ubonensis TaxID=101571 RepID=UPI000AF8DC64|nr:DUF3331 domain-containing protein [Burkholderia ubonensis]MDY7792845.1 DUF3331 domain-containing protein [Burkholderia ubonensis]